MAIGRIFKGNDSDPKREEVVEWLKIKSRNRKFLAVLAGTVSLAAIVGAVFSVLENFKP